MKQFITPESLRIDSYKLAAKVVQDNFKPDFIVAIWRGGAPIGCYVHEFLKYTGQKPDHIAIRTSRYTGIDTVQENIQIHNLHYLLERVSPQSKVLFVDDVWDTGLTAQAILNKMREELGKKCPKDMRFATVYYKPIRNKTNTSPYYYVQTSDQWLVFPHELEGLTLDEISTNVNPHVAYLLQTLICNLSIEKKL